PPKGRTERRTRAGRTAGAGTSMVKDPKQARSHETLPRILRSAAGLIGEGGVEAATVPRLVERSAAPVGELYARFGSRVDLPAPPAATLLEQARTRWEDELRPDRWEGRALGPLVEDLVRLLLETHRRDRALRLVLAVAEPPPEPR